MQKTSSCNTKISNLYIENKYHHLTLQKNSHYFWTRVYIIHQNNPVSKSLRYIITWFLPSRSYRCRAPRYRRHASSYRRHPIKLPSSVISDNFAYRRIAANLWWIIVQQGKSEGFDSCDRPSNLTQIGFKSSIFHPCDIEIWWMTPKNNKAHLLYNIKLCVLFHFHQWIKTGVTVQKRPIWVKLDDFFICVTLQFDVLPWKTIGHLFYATSSFVLHFVAIGEFKLELQSGKAQFWSKSTIFRAVWPSNLMDDLKQGKSEGFESCERPIVWKRPIWVKIDYFFSHVTLKFDGWPSKTIGHLFYATSAWCIIS